MKNKSLATLKNSTLTDKSTINAKTNSPKLVINEYKYKRVAPRPIKLNITDSQGTTATLNDKLKLTLNTNLTSKRISNITTRSSGIQSPTVSGPTYRLMKKTSSTIERTIEPKYLKKQST